jgi:hypothetical protein
MSKLILTIQQVIGLIQMGISTGTAIHGAVVAGKAKVTTAAGTEVTPEQLQTAIDELKAAGAAGGDEAVARILAGLED